jgi:signal transduction histidine kinase
VASIATAFAMIPVVPKAIEIPSPAKLIQANEALRLQEDSLRDLTGRLLTVQDEERRRLARELHDSMGQDLAAVKMLVERSAEQLDGHASPIAQQLKDAVASCDAAIQQVRTISHLLHPPMLDELGLSATLSWYVDGLVKRKLLNVQLVTSGIDTRLRHEVETAIFRITQECLTNVIRHSGSTSAIVKLARSDKDIVLTVSDHGKGIPPDKQAQMLEGGAIGVGLRGMRERVRQLGGSLAIESGLGGTHIIARFPANQAVLATDASS